MLSVVGSKPSSKPNVVSSAGVTVSVSPPLAPRPRHLHHNILIGPSTVRAPASYD